MKKDSEKEKITFDRAGNWKNGYPEFVKHKNASLVCSDGLWHFNCEYDDHDHNSIRISMDTYEHSVCPNSVTSWNLTGIMNYDS